MLEEKTRTDIQKLLKKTTQSRDMLIKGVTGLLLVCVIALMLPRGESVELDYKVGAVWAQKDLIAPFSFPIFRDEKDYQRDTSEARNNVYGVFERDTAAADGRIRALDTFFLRLKEVLAARERARPRDAGSASAEDSARFNTLATALDIPFNDREWELLSQYAPSGRLDEIRRTLEATTRAAMATGVIDQSRTALTRTEIALRRGTEEEIVPVSRLLDKNDLIASLEADLVKRYPSSNEAVSLGYKIGVMLIQPNIRFSEKATEKAVAAAIDAVPRTAGFVQENERIVSKHERITPDIRLKLESLRRVRADRGPSTDQPSQFAGAVLHVALLVLLYSLYLYLFRKRIFGSKRRLALIAIIFLLVCASAYLTREIDVNAPLEFLILVPVASMLLTIIFDSRVGFYGTVIIAFLAAGIRGNDYTIALSSLCAGALAVYTVRDVKSRTQIFRSLGFIFLGYALTIAALGAERYETTPVIAEQIAYALVNAIISPVLTYGLLIFLERSFRVTTDLTLMELAQFNHPLLRSLAEQAPGTYHHSMTIASLAEAGAAAVNANAVLARVGAYFHDIGKTIKPSYFVENQKGSRNRHEKLSPRMSSLIIGAHVKEGVVLAREHRLPEEVIDFIPMHHGTTRMDYFYAKAVELAKKDPDETKIDEIKEQDYRYPGPKPQTKETAILMLADAIEAAVRTIDDPIPQRLEDTIDELVKKRFEDGQLDECPLTMKDLTRIKAAFLVVLVGIYHTRVKYPDTARRGKPRKSTAPGLQTPGDRVSAIIREIDKP
jgi:putative nucleotidyltransferase with HDIG domain